MKMYLSSFRLGNNPERLFNMVGGNKKIAVIANATDFKPEEERKAKVQAEIDALSSLGLKAEEIDLRKYFGKSDELKGKVDEFNAVWVRGGNTFLLRQAYMKSGFGEIVKSKVNDPDFVYAGYSAGVCLLSPDMHGLDLVDDPNPKAEGYGEMNTIWEGLALIDFAFAPHYRSPGHPETELIEKSVKYFEDNNIPFKAISDGDVIII